VCADAPVTIGTRRGWLLEQLGEGFTLLAFGDRPPVDAVRCGDVVAPVIHVGTDLVDVDGVLAPRYDGHPGTVILIRPDQHLAARWRSFDVAAIEAALARALGRAA
jgi:3-(3-hydroxy-phenyl)propionate hydroxylase